MLHWARKGCPCFSQILLDHAPLSMSDVELFDAARDPDEVDNLARDPARHGDLMLAMNAKLNRLIETEVGLDAGQMLPGGIDGGGVATDAVKDV